MAKLSISDDLLICCACGAQYEVTEQEGLERCRVCDDPRQFVPPTGQKFTTLGKMKKEGMYRNIFEQSERDEHVWEIVTEPKFGIGQSARLITTPNGNILWDLVAYLDEETVRRIEELGGLKGIVISHPHFYTTWADWSSTFRCPVYTSSVDSVWLNRQAHPTATLNPLTTSSTPILQNITAHVCGGHFPGSLILHTLPPATTLPSLFVADTIFAVTSAHNPPPHHPVPGDGKVSYSFLWSIPNAIPLGPEEIWRIWKVVRGLEFQVTYGVMAKVSNVYELPEEAGEGGLKRRVLESAKVAVGRMGWGQHEIMRETL